MKKWIKAILSAAVAVALTVGMLGWLTDRTERIDSDYKYGPFFQQEADFDVLFLGTSHTLNGVFPMELWKDYGIVSYNFGNHNSQIPTTYWTLRNALVYTTPKLVVIDCYLLCGQEMIPDRDMIHTAMDAFPLNREKIAAARELTESTGKTLELLWDFIIYHDRWEQLDVNDFALVPAAEKGAESRIGVEESAEQTQLNSSLPPTEDTVGVQYMKKTIELCQDRGIDVLLMYLPCYAEDTRQMEANRMRQLAEEYGVGCVDFLGMDTVDFGTDCAYGTDHLNPSGARKVTEYLGQYIGEHYDVPDRRQDPDYSGWNEDYQQYITYKRNCFVGQAELKNYLMLLQDKHFSYWLYLAPNGKWHDGGIYEKLLANMGVDSAKLREDEPMLVTVDNAAGEVSYLLPGEEADTSFGRMSFYEDDEKYYAAEDGATLLEFTDQTFVGVVEDNETSEILTSSQFVLTTESTFKKTS